MKEYLITETRHEIFKYTYVVQAENEDEAMQQFENGKYYDEDSDYIDCVSCETSVDEIKK